MDGRPLLYVSIACLLGLTLLASTGCGSSPQQAIDGQRIEASQYDRVFDASVGTLRDAGFDVDRRDHRFGRITSEPKGSPTVFEPWIGDNSTLDQTLSSTLGDLRRTVTVILEPSEGRSSAAAVADGEEPPAIEAYALRVEVLLERQQVPERRLSGRTRGSVFADLDEVPQQLQQRGVEGSYWQPIGRDPQLESRLERRILDRAAKG